jgi:hypothetical protein
VTAPCLQARLCFFESARPDTGCRLRPRPSALFQWVPQLEYSHNSTSSLLGRTLLSTSHYARLHSCHQQNFTVCPEMFVSCTYISCPPPKPEANLSSATQSKALPTGAYLDIYLALPYLLLVIPLRHSQTTCDQTPQDPKRHNKRNQAEPSSPEHRQHKEPKQTTVWLEPPPQTLCRMTSTSIA